MAPPPPANLPLGQRILQLIQTLQFGWFVGHLTLIACSIRYALAYVTFKSYTKAARFSYRTVFVAAAVTYGVVVFKAMRARARAGRSQPGGLIGLVGDENIQYLIMAIVWLVSVQTPLALLPFAVYSIFHVATYTRTNLLPTLSPPAAVTVPPAGEKPAAPKQSAVADTIGRFVKEYYDGSMMLVATLEIFIWFRLLLSAIVFTKGSWILLVTYSIFFRARYEQSSFVETVIQQGTRNVDGLVANQSTPPVVKQLWQGLKQIMCQVVDATSYKRYLPGQPGKKSQ